MSLGASNTINVESLPKSVSLGLNLSNIDAINLSPTAQNLDGLQGKMTVTGQAGALLICNDQKNSAGQTYTIAGSTLARSGSVLVTFGPVGNLVLNASNGGNTRMGFIPRNEPTEWLSIVLHVSGSNPADIPTEGLSLYQGETRIGKEGAWYFVRCIIPLGGIRIVELSTQPPSH